LLSWRTKDAKFECLNIRGRMDFVNSFISYRGKSGVLSHQHAGHDGHTLTTKQSPLGPHETTLWNEGSSNILRQGEQHRKLGTMWTYL
jgi:hypothetical protein